MELRHPLLEDTELIIIQLWRWLYQGYYIGSLSI